MWRCVLLGCVLGACSFEITGTTSDDEPPRDAGGDAIDEAPPHWLVGYTHRRRIDVSSGQAITLDDFVVGIILTEDAGLAANARDDGQDLIVTTADDTILEYELERFDGTTGAMTMWVRVPTLPSQTTLYLYYGGEIRLHDPRATWDPQTFRAVWHLTDTDVAAARDSAGEHHLSTSGSATPAMQDGLAGVARGMDGVNDSLRDNADDNTLDFGTESFSFSVWVLVVESAGFYDMPMYKGGSAALDEGYDLELGTGGWRAFVGDGTRNHSATFTEEVLGAWVHLMAVCDRGTQQLRAYKDGVQADAVDIADTGSVSSDATLTLGSNGTGSYWFRGRLDEPRIYARALSPEWIAAEHANLRTPATFAAVGAEEIAP